MRVASRLALVPALFLAAAGALCAQSPNWGLGLSIVAPTGDFREKVYPPTADLGVQQIEGYDIGLGGQITVSMPVGTNLAFRFGMLGMGTEGTNTAAGCDTLILSHTLFSLTGEVQLFFDNAYWHRGFYIAAGVSADFERFESKYDYTDSWGDPIYFDIRRKSRLGGSLGVGHTFKGSGLNFTLEAVYHKTLNGNDPLRLEPPGADFLRIGFGIVF